MVKFINEQDFRDDVKKLSDAIKNKNMIPIVLFGENGIGKSPVIHNIAGNEAHETYKYYGNHKDISSKIKEMTKEALNRGFNHERNDRPIQHIFSVNDEAFFEAIQSSGLFRCYRMRRTRHEILTKVLADKL
ncbi:hypothetical protein [Vibrio cyclitrophicus]|uniref:hypothetical protein n=1 Tax=Vibrio cyclitrophicus TaxID=47951 RepID=UPI000C8307B6|nr:hypothetical protein [Vibrio cyclitrophicus]PMH44673.1 hypothetical protein BCU67_07115 [Vibrio cyclitrophicus]